MRAATKDPKRLEELMCKEFGEPLRKALLEGTPHGSIAFQVGGRTISSSSKKKDSDITLDIAFVDMKPNNFETNPTDEAVFVQQSKHFLYHKPKDADAKNVKEGQPINIIAPEFVEMTVAASFPCPLASFWHPLVLLVLVLLMSSSSVLSVVSFLFNSISLALEIAPAVPLGESKQ